MTDKPFDRDREIDDLIAEAQALARRMNASFVSDPAKMGAFAAKERGPAIPFEASRHKAASGG